MMTIDSTTEYFDDLLPTSDAECSDNQCPCLPSTPLPRGTGYMYVSEEVVDMRKDALTVRELEEKLNRLTAQAGDARLVFFDRPMVTGILTCERGAKLRGLDLEVAGADARHWWKTGRIPLRATPLSDGTTSVQNSTDDSNCFVATAILGRDHHDLVLLRSFRDQTLLASRTGRFFVKHYYRYGPRMAAFVARHPLLGIVINIGLIQPAILILRRAEKTSREDHRRT